MNIILLIAIFISAFQFVLLVNKRAKSFPDIILTFWMFVAAIHLVSYYLNYLGYWEIYPHLVGTTVPFPFLYGPLLYLYILYSLRSEHKLRRRDYLHFFPSILSLLYMCRFYFFYSEDEKRLVDSGEINDFNLFIKIQLIAFVISAISYSILSYKLLNNYKKLIDTNFSNDEHINLYWLKGFIWGVATIFFTAITITISRDFLGVDYTFNPDYIIYSMLSLAILLLGYYGIRHQNIFVDNVIVNLEEDLTGSDYKNSGLKDVEAKNKYKSLLLLMKNDKPYLEPKLTLHTLAQLLEISPNHLSQIINQYDQQNFNDFVNKYRVDEFIKKASVNANYSFLANALDSGFNSKSTFNTVFKKIKGTTPSQYMAKLNNK